MIPPSPSLIARRILAVLAATLFVAAFTLTTALPDKSLAAALVMLDGDLVRNAHEYLPAWIWSHLAMPLLVRPAWLLPAALGIVASGAIISIASRAGPYRPGRRQRRS